MRLEGHGVNVRDSLWMCQVSFWALSPVSVGSCPSFPRRRESMLNLNSTLSMGSRVRGGDGIPANT
jgi:hypothetical protein